MPQQSFFKEAELHKLVITLWLDELRGATIVSLVGCNREGEQIAATGLHCTGWQEAELLPELAKEAVTGWLYRGAYDAIQAPAAEYRQKRRQLRQEGF